MLAQAARYCIYVVQWGWPSSFGSSQHCCASTHTDGVPHRGRVPCTWGGQPPAWHAAPLCRCFIAHGARSDVGWHGSSAVELGLILPEVGVAAFLAHDEEDDATNGDGGQHGANNDQGDGPLGQA